MGALGIPHPEPPTSPQHGLPGLTGAGWGVGSAVQALRVRAVVVGLRPASWGSPLGSRAGRGRTGPPLLSFPPLPDSGKPLPALTLHLPRLEQGPGAHRHAQAGAHRPADLLDL